MQNIIEYHDELLASTFMKQTNLCFVLADELKSLTELDYDGNYLLYKINPLFRIGLSHDADGKKNLRRLTWVGKVLLAALEIVCTSTGLPFVCIGP